MSTTGVEDGHPIAFLVFVAYVVLSGLLMFATIRRPLVGWYHSNSWFIEGKGIIDILIKQIGMRLTIEALAFGIACVVGSLGGNVYTIIRARRMRRPEAIMDE